MSADPVQTLTCVLENLEELVFPHLEEEHAVSAGRCTSILLRNLILRLTHEPELLVADTAEKRVVAAELAHRLAGTTGARVPALAELADELAAVVAVAQQPATSSLAHLTVESNRLKDVLERFVHVLHAERGSLGDEEFHELQKLVRVQLRAQLDRDLSLVSGPLGTAPFPY